MIRRFEWPARMMLAVVAPWALQEIAKEIEYAWDYLGFPREKGVDLGEDVALYASVAAQCADITREWEPYQDEETEHAEARQAPANIR
jgi:hypothetical protein